MLLYFELKRRNVFRVAVAYIAAAWLVTEVAGTLFPVFGVPDWGVRFIVIVFALGFIPTLIFSWAYELTAEGLKREKDVVRETSVTHFTARRLDGITIVLITVAIVFVTAERLWLVPWLEERSEHHANAPAEIVQTPGLDATDSQYPPNSVAVLPFVNMSDDVSNEYFSDGISEEILNALARVPELKVVGRTSSFAFKGQSDDLRRIGAALGVAHILEGSVRKSGDRLRISAQLINVEDGYHLWSDSFDRELTDVFAIQDEIAGAIFDQLMARLLPESQFLETAPRTNPDVYDLYLLARQAIDERTLASLESAAGLLDRAIVLDPDYAPAYAQRGIVWLLLSERAYGPIPRVQAAAQARVNLDRALQLRPNLAEALAGLGLCHFFSTGLPGNDSRGAEFLEQALTINPSLLDASNWLYFTYRETGQWRKGLKILEELMDRDPLYLPGAMNAAWTYNKMGRQSESRALIERISPYFSEDELVLMNAEWHFSLGQFSSGLPLAEAASRLNPSDETRRVLSIGLDATHQYERSVEEGNAYHKPFALWLLGRSDEALMLAHELASAGISATPLFVLMNANARSAELIAYLEDRWPDLDDFETGFLIQSWQIRAMSNASLAYARMGDRQKFDETMERTWTAIERMRAEGLDNYNFSLDQADYYALTGEHEKALSHLGAAIDSGYIGAIRLVLERPALEPLESDSRFKAIQTRMLEHLNRERDQLGLAP